VLSPVDPGMPVVGALRRGRCAGNARRSRRWVARQRCGRRSGAGGGGCVHYVHDREEQRCAVGAASHEEVRVVSLMNSANSLVRSVGTPLLRRNLRRYVCAW